MQTPSHHLGRLTRAVALIGFGGLVLLALLTFYDGTARFIGMPRMSGFADLGELLFPIVIASCFPAGLLRQKHISIRLLGKACGTRTTAWLELLAALATLTFFAILAWQFVVMTVDLGAAGRTTQTIEWVLQPWWWITTSIMVLCVPVQIFVVAAWLHAAVTGQSPAHIDAETTDASPL